MLKYILVATHLLNGQPNVWALDTGLTASDCRAAIGRAIKKPVTRLDPMTKVPTSTVVFSCEPQIEGD